MLVGVAVFWCCKFTPDDSSFFKSNFIGIQPRTWVGQEYWANPMQDWRLAHDRLECLVSAKNRNIHLLTRQLNERKGELDMKVRLGFFNQDISEENENWAGFSIGAAGEFNDYRDNAIFGKGINIGVCTNGALFIGEPSPNNINKDIIKALKGGIDLRVSVAFDEKKACYTLDFSVHDIETGKTIGHIAKNDIAPELLVGDLVLVSNFNNDKVNYSKSVWFKDWELSGTKLSKHDDRAFGPILFSQYTLSRKTLKLTAQMAPIDTKNKKVDLQIKEANIWRTVGSSFIDPLARTANFKLRDWDDTKTLPYRLVYRLEIANGKAKDCYWEGVFRKNPKEKQDIVIAGFTGNNDLGFPNNDIVEQVAYHNPDVLFFSGDQIYEPVGGYGIVREPLELATLDYLRKWYMFGWAYRDLLKDRPTVTIIDDHDVYMGNIWGENGKASIKSGTKTEIQDSGGYQMNPVWVNMVEKTQTSHLPDPYDPTPIQQNIGVYYTQMNYGGISYAIIEDRKFKSAPKGLLPEAEIINGWPQNKTFDIINKASVSSAKLLGDRQLKFLNDWSSDWSYDSEMKVLLSQTIFANVATLPKEAMTDAVVPKLRILNEGEYPEHDFPVTDMDSNGWPQAGRNHAIKAIRKGFAFHLAGDQHLGSVIQYGVDEFGDAGYAFCVPSISNFWPRRWYPFEGGANRKENTPKYTGDFKDGFGNKITVEAISNPLFTNKKPSKLYDRAAGYGIVRFNKNSRDITLECWPRGAEPQNGDTKQYKGWPVTINQLDNFGTNFKWSLPKIEVTGITKPVIQIVEEENNDILYTIRSLDTSFIPKVPVKGNYTVKVIDSHNNVLLKKHVKPTNEETSILFDFKKKLNNKKRRKL
ncbi:alkaline phosphatase D family protein [Tamlana sp. 2201CG12-4]|uniref:alkaline phosphatase D family protein n=1 Tax=Tamlana sp. 2201CG12-4 TaxID=3112582 RepID=UPI002DBB8A52|nr:alkaline phosphatase D family protein [Tamlana sp. 2201CG12-4]MEC3907167.1 alkaline phosphatase D family protein [Tamlana sp. 2201CG12-4]